MRSWRIGTISMGLTLIFMGVGIFAAQFQRELGYALLRNCWPFVLVALGLELLLSNYFLRKQESRFTYDLLSVVFVGLLGLISLGVYALNAAGVWDRLAEVTSGEIAGIEHRAELTPAGRIGKVAVDCGGYWRQVRILDGPGEKIVLRVSGQGLKCNDDRMERTLAMVGSLEQVGDVVYVRLRNLRFQSPWSPRVDRVEVMIPPQYKVEVTSSGNLDLSQFHGRVERLVDPIEEMRQRLEEEKREELQRLRDELAELREELEKQ